MSWKRGLAVWIQGLYPEASQTLKVTLIIAQERQSMPQRCCPNEEIHIPNQVTSLA